jgi:hypothetical protein
VSLGRSGALVDIDSVGGLCVFCFCSCHWHGGCPKCRAHPDFDGYAVIPALGKTPNELLEETRSRLGCLGDRFKLRTIWECEWDALVRKPPFFVLFCFVLFCLSTSSEPRAFRIQVYTDPLAQRIHRDGLDHSPKIHKHNPTPTEMSDLIQAGEITGFVCCDLRIPDRLRAEFDEFPPLVCFCFFAFSLSSLL